MQKRIKFEQKLSDANSKFPQIWSNLLNQINQSSPILLLNDFGAISYIQNCLYLSIERKILANYSQVDEMITHESYFLAHRNVRQPFRALSHYQQYIIQIFISQIKPLLNASHIYLYVIDFKKVGKVAISKNMIQYFNGEHHWKYQIKKNAVQLPTLLHYQPQEQQSMSRKFSLSKTKSQGKSMQKQKRKLSFKINRSRSAKKLNNSFNKNLNSEQKISIHNSRLATECYEKKAKSQSKEQIQKLKAYKTEKIYTEPINSINKQTTQQQIRVYNRLSPSIKRQKSSSKLKSQSKIDVKQKKIKLQLKPERQKLTISDKLREKRVPNERKTLLQSQERSDKYMMMIKEFVSRQTLFDTKNKLASIQKKQRIEFIQEISLIYLQKQQKNDLKQLKRRRLEKAKSTVIGRIKEAININYSLLQQRLEIKPQEVNIFNQFFNLVQLCKRKIQQTKTAYAIDIQQYNRIVMSAANSFKSITTNLSPKSQIRVALLLYDLIKLIQNRLIDLINRVINKNTKVLSISIRQQNSFNSDVQSFIQQIQNILTPLKDYIISSLSEIWRIQSDQLQNLKQAQVNLRNFILSHNEIINDNILKFRTASCKTVLNASYNTEKQGLALIKKLDELKQSVENERQFKSQLNYPGIRFNLSSIKQHYLTLISQKYYQIYTYFFKVYEKSKSELSNKLKTIIVINVDYLSDYKCRQHRLQIEEHYRHLLESLMLLITHFFYLLRQSQINNFLNEAYQFKVRIQQNLFNFNTKLQQYRNNSNKTIKILQIKNKQQKSIYQNLTQQLKQLILQFNTEKNILQLKNQILRLDSQYQQYNINNKKIVQAMKENQMAYWEDDHFFVNNLHLLKLSLQFLEGFNYKVFFNTLLSQLTINEFYNAFEQFNKFINQLAQTKIQKVFKPTFNLVQSNLILIELLLYKEYTDFQLQKAKEIGVDITLQRSSKIYTAAKRYQNFDKKKFQAIVQIYRNSRLNQFNLYHNQKINSIRLQKYKGSFDLTCIKNYNELKQFLQDYNTIKSSQLLSILQQLYALSQQILIFNKIVYLISESTIADTLKQSILLTYNEEYEKLLTFNATALQIQRFRSKLYVEQSKYMQIYYHQKISQFSRYSLCTVQQLVHLQEWQSNQEIARNIRYIYEGVDDVIFDDQGNIQSFVIAKDKLTFSKPFNIFEKEGQIAKIIYIHAQNFIRNSLGQSQFACIYIKLLIWHIYFTQQIELCFMTQSPLNKVKEAFLQLIKEITNQIRYDIKLHHKSYEIIQLNFFIHHIEKIKSINQVSDFQWLSTVRYYEKLKIVRVQQNQKTYDYSFQIKRPLNYDPSFQLQANISYGFKQCYPYYEISAYILGKPFVTFKHLNSYGFQANYSVILNFIKKFQYFIRIIVEPSNYKCVNHFHKKIIQLSFKKFGLIEQQTLNMPIFFQYPTQSAIPICFPEKYRNFSKGQFRYDLNLIFLLQVNKYQQTFEQSSINIDVLTKVLNIINIKKNLTTKKLVDFVEKLSSILSSHPEHQEIYKFCHRYFMLNYQTDNQQLSMILKDITKKSPRDLSSIILQSKEAIQTFLQKQKSIFVIYGPTSYKSTIIKQLKIPYFNDIFNSQKFYMEGFQEYLMCKKKIGQDKIIKWVIEDRCISHLQPSLVSEAVLHYCNDLSALNVEQIFKNKIIALKIQGQIGRLWTKFHSLYNTYIQVATVSPSLLAMSELVLRCYQKHFLEFLKQLEQQDRKQYIHTINKETVKAFLVISYELFYYMLQNQQKKKFSEKIKTLPFMLENSSEQLSSLTCKGLNCQKIQNLIKKQKVTFKSIINYNKEFILVKKYLQLQQAVFTISKCTIANKILRQQIQSIEQYNKIDITLHHKYIQILRARKYENILYIIHDIHLQQKPKLTYLKIRQQVGNSKLGYYLMVGKDEQYMRTMKMHVTFKFSDIQIQHIYKYQNKQNLSDHIQIKCKNIWENRYIENEPTFLMFLINVSVKLPSQYYKKYFARQLILAKFRANSLAIDTINENELLIRKAADVSSTNAYLVDGKGHSQEMSEMQVNKKIQMLIEKFNLPEKLVYQQYYKKIVPYTLLDKIYVITEQIGLLPCIISHIHDRKYFKLREINFMSDLIEIIENIYSSGQQYTLIVQQPLTSSQHWQQFMSYYLLKIDIVNIYPQLKQYTQLLASKQQYVYRLPQQSIAVKDNINSILYGKIKIIISQTPYSQFTLNHNELYINNIVYLNCCLTNAHKKMITSQVTKKLLSVENRNICQIFHQINPFILQLVQNNLLFINRLTLFIRDIIAVIKAEFAEAIRIKEALAKKKKLFDHLFHISEQINSECKIVMGRQNQNKSFLNSILQRINSFQIQGAKNDNHFHYQDLNKARYEFRCNQQSNSIWLQGRKSLQAIYHLLQSTIFANCLTIQCDVPILTLTSQAFRKIIENESFKQLQSIECQLLQQGIGQFILLKYAKFVGALAKIYQNLPQKESLIANQVRQINYYYLLDIGIQLKNKQKAFGKQFDHLVHRKKIVDNFSRIMEQMEHYSIKHQQLLNLHIFSKIKHLIRSYSFEQHQSYPLKGILDNYSTIFLSRSHEFIQYLLQQQEEQFNNLNLHQLIEKYQLIAYDPYSQLEILCDRLSIKIIYVNSEQDTQQLYDYKFKNTIFCIRIQNLEEYYARERLIRSCMEIISKKHPDLKQNKLEKLVISISDKNILSQIKEQFHHIHLAYSFNKFVNESSGRILDQQHRWCRKKQEYSQRKVRLNKEIQLIKSLNLEEISLYINKMEGLIDSFQHSYTEISKMSNMCVFSTSQEASLKKIFAIMMEVHRRQEFPLNLSLRLLKHVKIEDLIDKYESNGNLPAREYQDLFKNTLLSNRPKDIKQQLQSCISYSRYVAIIYEQFNKKIIKEILQIEQSKKYTVRTIIEISEQELKEFVYSTSQNTGISEIKQVVLFFVKFYEVHKLKAIINKCSVLWI